MPLSHHLCPPLATRLIGEDGDTLHLHPKPRKYNFRCSAAQKDTWSSILSSNCQQHLEIGCAKSTLTLKNPTLLMGVIPKSSRPPQTGRQADTQQAHHFSCDLEMFNDFTMPPRDAEMRTTSVQKMLMALSKKR